MEALGRISQFYRISNVVMTDVLKSDLYHMNFNVTEHRGRSRGVVIVENSGGQTFLHCELHKNRRVLVQVVCRHFQHQMGILSQVSAMNENYRITYKKSLRIYYKIKVSEYLVSKYNVHITD